jgi:sarcosine oxidase
MATKRSYEVIVLGLGGLGSASLYWLSRRLGNEVLGIEQFSLGHPYGSSQDHSRIIRLAYDDPAYAALAPHTFIAWREVEAESGIQLVYQTGSLILGPDPDLEYSLVDHYAEAMTRSGIPFETLDARETMQRFPQYRLRPGDRSLYQSYAGLVDPGKANAVHIALARGRGASVLENTRIESLKPIKDGVSLETSNGSFTCRRVVITSGAWTNQVLAGAGINLPLTVTEEQVTYFSTPHLRQFTPDRFPIWIWEGEQNFYGFPIYGEVATKAGEHIGGDAVTPETRKMQPNARPYNNLVRFLEERIPDFIGPVLYTKPCLYTMPPDKGFIIDTLPGLPQIAVAIGAGHSFKFACLIGWILSQLALEGKSVFPIEAMRIDRPAITDPDFPNQVLADLAKHA